MTLLSSPDLLLARVTAAEALDGTAIYGGGTALSDGVGGFTQTFVAAGTVPCRLAPMLGGEAVEGDRLSDDSEYIFTFAAETPVNRNSQIVHAGGTFTVTAVRQRSQEITRRVEVRKVE